MKPKIKYIELKSGYHDDGPAWIGRVEFSKTGKTIYFNGHAFKGNGHGTCFDIETRENYWITGIKKDGPNRHWAGKGKVMIDKAVIDEFLKLKEWDSLDLNRFEIVEVEGTDKKRFADIENGSVYEAETMDKYPGLKELSTDELKDTVNYLRWKESRTNSNNGVKFITVKKLEAEALLEHRQDDIVD